MIRVLVVLPLYGGSLPIGRYAAAGLEENGCLVDIFEAPAFYSACNAIKQLQVSTDRSEFLRNSFLQFVAQAILAKVETFCPDLVLCLAQAPLSRQVLRRLRDDGVPTAMWFVEDHRLFTYWRAFAPYYDFFAVIQKEPFLSELQQLGVENTLYLPLAALPSFHKKTELTPVEKKLFGADLSFLGAGYPNRQEAFTRFTHYDFKIWGTEWENSSSLMPFVQRNGERVSPEDAVKIYNATSINLNLHSSVQTKELVSQGDFVNPRTFELASCGAFQLVDQRTLMPELFAEDELATFTSLDDLEQKIQHYLRAPEEREAMALRGQQRVLREHTYAIRMKQLLDFVQERLPGFATSSPKEQLFDSIDPELRAEIQNLLDSLRLPPGVPFTDLVAAVRKQKNKLSATETAVLFLDEWKKLYLKQ